MAKADFPDYAIKIGDEARACRRRLSARLQQIADGIEAELSWNPNARPDRVSNSEGGTRVYRDPESALEVTFEVDRERGIIYFYDYTAPTVQAPMIFISYSHQDKECLKQLKKFLIALQEIGVLKFWEDTQLIKGRPWREQIKEVLDSATAGLLLVSQDFLISNFIGKEELPVLLEAAEKGKKIYWLQVTQSTVFQTHQQITKFQAILDDPTRSLDELDDPQRNRAMVEIVKVLQRDFATR